MIAGYCYGSKELIAFMEYEGYTNTELFLAWVDKGLCKEIKSNQVVIMGNASFHKSAKVKDLIEKAGARLFYLPTYSPDMNPIEHVLANLKKILREHPKREKHLSQAIADSLRNLFIG